MALTKIPGFGIDTSTFALPTANVTGNLTAGNANLGNLVIANFYSGNGSLLSSITGANVTGFVPNANIANTAYAVSGGNVAGQVGNSLIAGTVYTAAQPNITSVGTLTSLNVTGNITSGNANLGNAVTANYFLGNGSLLTGLPASYSNTNVESYLPTYTGNITAGNVSVTGNANVGNLNTTGSVTAGSLTLTGNLVVGGTTTYVNSTTTSIVDPIVDQGGGANNAALATNDNKDRGTTLHYYTTAPVDAFMGWKNSNSEFIFASNSSVTNDIVVVNSYGNVRANYFIGNGSQLTGIAATTAVSLTNGTSNVIVTNNGNVTFGVGGNASIMTVTSTGANFGGYVSALGNIISQGNVSAGYYIGNGSQLTGIGLLSNGTSNVSIPATNGNIIFSVAGQYAILQVTGTGTNAAGYLTVTGALTAPNITTSGFANIQGTLTAVNANLGNLATANYFNGTLAALASNQPNIQSVGTLTSLNVSNIVGTGTGNITSLNANLGNLVKANYFQGDGGLLSNIGSPNTVISGTSNINIPVTNGNITVTVGGVANTVVFTGTGVNVAGYVTVTGNTTTGNLSVTSNITSGNASLGNLVTANYVNVTSNVTAGNFVGVLANGNSNVNIPSSNGNVNISASGTANVVVIASTGVNITGNLSAGNANLGNLVTSNYFSGKLDSLSYNQPNITSVGTLLNVVVSNTANIGGNVFIGNLVSNILLANTGVIVTTGNITAPNANLGNLVTANYTTAVLTTASQPNITSIGTLGNLTVTNNVSANTLTTGSGTNGNLTINPDGTGQLVIDSSTPVVLSGNTLTSNGNIAFTGANVSLGAVGNVRITGGSTNQYLKTDGTGNLSWGTPAGGGGGGGTALTYTADTTPPSGPNIADQWYNTTTSTLYEYISDGTSSYWVDIQTPTVSSSSPAPLMIQNKGSNLTYASTLNFAGAGINATYTGNTVTATVVATETISPFLLMGA